MNAITLLPGHSKNNEVEGYASINFYPGDLYAIVGDTGSGKSRLIKDIEQLASGDTVTGRFILLDGTTVSPEHRAKVSKSFVAHLGQSMRFVLDVSVAEFVAMHCRCREKTNISLEAVLDMTNRIAQEPISPEQNLNLLSGGQSRALMIADIALICDSPIVLIDEIENAGIDKIKALRLLTGTDKLVLIVTHDPHTALMAPKRLVLKNGAISTVVERTKQEEEIFRGLERTYHDQTTLQWLLKRGEILDDGNTLLE